MSGLAAGVGLAVLGLAVVGLAAVGLAAVGLPAVGPAAVEPAVVGPAVAGLAAAVAPPATAQTPDTAPAPARALYVAGCESCHGTDGRGNPRIDAPVLAGLSAAYLARQLDGFRRGYRGSHPEDIEGREMRPMVEELAGADLAAVVAWLASLSAPEPAEGARAAGDAAGGVEAPGGDPARGRILYAACAVCHGRSGEGDDALAAPRLAGQASWYTVRQLRKFIDGVRGSHPDDTSGASMRASVADLAPLDAADIVAWIETLPAS